MTFQLLLLVVPLLHCIETDHIDIFDKALGLYRDAHPQFVYVTNGATPATIAITLEPEPLNITLPVSIQSHHSSQKCEARQEILDKVDQINTELGNYSKGKLEKLQMDARIIERSDRAVFATLGLAVASGVASGLSGGLIDHLFSQRHNRVQNEIEALKSQLELTESQLQSTTVELCILTSELFNAKVENYMITMKAEIDHKISSLVANILEKNLEFEQKVKLCQLVNPRATTVACTRVSRAHDFKPTVIRIQPTANGGIVEIEVSSPLIMQQLEAHKLVGIGNPSLVDNVKILSVPKIPKFITPDNVTLDGSIVDNVVEAESLEINEIGDYSCLNSQPECDFITKRVDVDFLIKTVDKHIIVSSWTKCSFSFERFGQIKTLHFRMQTKILPKSQGTLICGGREIKLSSSSLETKVQFTNHTVNINYIAGPLAHNNPLWDPDHPMAQINSGFSGTSLSDVILTCFITSALVFGLVTLKILIWFKKLKKNVTVV